MPNQSTLLRFCEQCGEPFAPSYPTRRFCCRSCGAKYARAHPAGGRKLSHYGYVMILNRDYPHDGRPQYQMEHRLVMEAYLGRPLLPAPLEVVDHRDGNRQNNDISNLELKTQAEHALRHTQEGNAFWHYSHQSGENHYLRKDPSRIRRGEESTTPKLTERDVIEIRKRYAAGGVTQTELGREFGVTSMNIWQIVHHKSWQHIP